jgi:hypothetical protein
MKQKLIDFYNEYVADGSNISETAEKNGITNTMCFIMVQFGKTLKK